MSKLQELLTALTELESVCKSAPKQDDECLVVRFEKTDADQQMVWGWAYVNEINGQPVIDSQGDYISEVDLVQAAHAFMNNHRVGLREHEGQPVGQVVESVVFTKSMQVSLGINLNKVGWFIGMKINDPATWEEIKSGQKNAFSIGGTSMFDVSDSSTTGFYQA